MATNGAKGGSPGVGNAFAYFIVVYAVAKGWLTEEQSLEAVAMGGFILTWAALHVWTPIANGIVNGVKYLFGVRK